MSRRRSRRFFATASSDGFGTQARHLVALDFEFVEVEAGRAVFAGTPGKHANNPIGALHSCLTTSQACTTLELKVAYHKPVTNDTGLLRAEGQLLSFGQRVAFAEASLTDARGKLYASATSTLLVFNR
jgi:acyl-coenzyme A thioesterase PaaI-like protein